MYLRSTPRRNKDGSEVRYLQLAHNVWDPQKRRSAVQVVYNFGREDAANREALQRLVASVTRYAPYFSAEDLVYLSTQNDSRVARPRSYHHR